MPSRSILSAINRTAVPLTFSPHDYDPLLEWIGDRGLGLIGQFDAVIHIDRTMALIPFERSSVWEKGEVPETYPFAV